MNKTFSKVNLNEQPLRFIPQSLPFPKSTEAMYHIWKFTSFQASLIFSAPKIIS